MTDNAGERGGNLRVTPLSRMLYNHYLAGKTGALEIYENVAIHRIYFSAGKPVGVVMAYDYAQLEDMLLERGRIDTAIHSKIIVEKDRGEYSIEEILVGTEVLTKSELETLLVEQIMQRIGRLSMLADAEFRFEENAICPNRGIPVNPFKVILFIVNYFKTPQQFHELENRYANKLLLPHLNLQYILPAMELENNICKILSTWHEAHNITDISVLTGMPLRETLALVSLLEILDLLTITDKAARKSAVEEKPEPSQADLEIEKEKQVERERVHAEQKKMLGEIREFNKKALSKNPLEILGVAREASQAEIRKAYVTLTRRYHPDNVQQGFPDEVIREFEKASSAVNEAYSVLKDPEKQAAFLKLLDDPIIKGDINRAEMRKRASMDSEQGFVYFHRQNYPMAIKHLKRALMIFPYEVMNLARLGWAVFNNKEGEGDRTAEAVELINRGLSIQPDNDQANYFMAKILIAQKRDREAESYLEKAERANPNNYEARRDLKMLQMRLGKINPNQ